MIVRISTLLLLAMAGGIVMSSCTSYKDRSSVLKGTKTHTVVLACPRANIPDLQMSMPEGFDPVPLTGSRDDKYVISRSGDPEPVPGQIVVTVTRSPYPVVPDSSDVVETMGKIGDASVVWREFRIEDATHVIHQRELISDDILERFNKQSSDRLFVHVIVGGTDEKIIEQLLACVETLRILPARPNL